VQFVRTAIPDVVIIEPDVYRDARGFFLETYHAEKYRHAGIEGPFVQDNQSRSVAGTVRGLHLQLSRPQGKLVRVIEGEIFDVAVDVRRGSATFGRWVGVTLSAENFRQCYLPPGFAHGFAVVSGIAQVEYKCTDVYDPKGELGIAWNDPAIAIEWPVAEPFLSERDTRHPVLAAVMERLPVFRPSTDL
jgi:dTDP-4-dehydrorhamnose 3,5-epimerase